MANFDCRAWWLKRRGLSQMYVFWGFVDISPHLKVKYSKNPILGAWIGIFQLNVQNIKTCILSKLLHRLPPNFAQSKDHQVLFVGGPNTCKTNPRWRTALTAAILKNRKSAISPEWFNVYSRNLARWHTLCLRTGPEVKISNFWKSKMANGGH